MSRHRDVRNLNIHDELAEDEVSDTYEEEEEMTDEQRGQMDVGLAQVRSVLGDPSESGISDKQITDALWESYFDVEGTISWLLDQKAKQAAAAAKKAPDHEEAIQAPLSALQRLALERRKAGSMSTGNTPDKPSGLAGLAKGLSRKTLNSAAQSVLDKPSATPNVSSTPQAPPPKTSKLSALAQKSAAQRATSSTMSAASSPGSVTPSPAPNTPKSSSLSKLALRIKAQKDAQEAAARPPPPIDAHPAEPNVPASKPEFELFGNLRPANILLPTGPGANHAYKIKTGPSSFGNILISKRDTAEITSSLARIYSEVVSSPPSAFQFNTPSPDDTVMAAREGTRLNAYKKASTVIGSRK